MRVEVDTYLRVDLAVRVEVDTYLRVDLAVRVEAVHLPAGCPDRES